MKSLTLGQRVTLGFVTATAVTVALGLVAFNQFLAVSSAGEYLARGPVPGTICIIGISGAFKENFALVEKHLSARDKAAVSARVQANKTKIDGLLHDYEATMTVAEDREIFAKFKEARAAFVSEFKAVLELSNAGRAAEALAAAEERMEPAYERLDVVLKQLVEFNQRNLRGGVAQVSYASHHGRLAIMIGLGAALLVSGLTSFYIVRSSTRALAGITSTLAASSGQTAAASAQIAAASQSLAQGASEQAASLEETSASIEELSSMTKRNADGSRQAKATATAARGLADTGVGRMQAMQNAMEAIRSASVDITKILKTIDEIAFQTNILALNAAVEAARAGEHGAGFAVVAEEVRALAQRSATAAKETAAKIEHSVSQSQHGVQLSADVAGSFTEIRARIEQLDSLLGEIATASQEQSQGIGQISTAISQMDKVTQSNAGNAEETAAAAEELSAQAAMQQEAVHSLQAFAGTRAPGTAHAATREHPAPKLGAAHETKPAAARAPVPAGHASDFFQDA